MTSQNAPDGAPVGNVSPDRNRGPEPVRTLINRRRFLQATAGTTAAIGLGTTASATGGPPRSTTHSAAQGEELALVIGTLGEANTINPFQSSDSEADWRCKILYDEFVRIDPETYEVVPGIAAKWDVQDLVITFTLQPEVMFSDGSPLTADDIAFTITGLLAKATASPNQSKFLAIAGAKEFVDGTADAVSGIKVVDPGTLEITLAEPDAPFLFNMHFVWPVPKAKLEGQDLANTEFFQAPIGAGPFAFESWEGADFIAVRNENFWEADKPAITRVTHRFIGDSQTLVLALQGNEIDGSNYPNPIGREVLEENPDLELIVPPFGSPNGWFFNCAHPVLSDKNVRKAIAMALNVEQFAADSLLGLGKPGLGPIAPDNWAFDPDLTPIPYDVAAAQKLITDAGAEGTQLRFAVNSGNILREDWLTFTQQALTEIGIEVVPELVDYATHVDAVQKNRDFDVSGVDFAGVTDEPSGLYDQFHSESAGNFSGLSNPDLDALLVKAKGTLEQEAAKPIYAEIQAILMDELPMHFAWYRPFLQAINKSKFAGYRSSGSFGLFYFLQDWTGPKA